MAFNPTLPLAASTPQSNRSAQAHTFPPPSPPQPRSPCPLPVCPQSPACIFLYPCHLLGPPPKNISPPSLVVSCPRATHPAHPHTQCAFLLIGCELLREQACLAAGDRPGSPRVVACWPSSQKWWTPSQSGNGAVQCQWRCPCEARWLARPWRPRSGTGPTGL